MSFIHYKLITNQNYEKIAFDGVSLSVGEIKKLVMEKKFRKYTSSSSSSNSSMSRRSEVDLEVTNVDTNEVYKNDAEMIPKNSRVQINRVVKNIGPAIAGGTITQTHKESEQMAENRLRSRHLNDKNVKSDLDLDDSILLGSNGSKTSDTLSGQDSPDMSILYDDILTDNVNTNVNNSDDLFDQNDPNTFNLITQRIDIKIPLQNSNGGVCTPRTGIEQERPPDDFLCPFDDGLEKHIMDSAIIVPCCGYFICCEKCIRDKLANNQTIECPQENCSQEITSNLRFTPYTPIRNKIIEYFKTQSNNTQIPVDKLKTKFPINQNEKAQHSPINNQPSPIKNSINTIPQNNSSNISPNLSTNRPVIKLSVKLNSPKVNPEVKNETPVDEIPEDKKSHAGSPVSSRSSSPSKISSDSESNSKVSHDGSISPVSDSQESRASSPSSISSPSLKDENQDKNEHTSENSNLNKPETGERKPEDKTQPIQPLYNQSYAPPQQFYPYNMPPGQMYPQIDSFFNQRFPHRPNFPMQQTQPMYNPNIMRFPQPGPIPGQAFYPTQMFPTPAQQFIPDQFYPNRPPMNGFQYQNYQQKWNGNNIQNRRRSRSRSRSRRSPDRSYRRKRSYSRSRSRSRSRSPSSRYHKRSKHRSRSRSRSRSRDRRDKRPNYRRRSSSRKRDRSRSRSKDKPRNKKQYDDKRVDKQINEKIDEKSIKPVNKENEMNQKEKTVHKLTNLMHKKSKLESTNISNGGVTVTLSSSSQVNESQKPNEDTKKKRIVFLIKANTSLDKKESDETKKDNSIKETVHSSPVKKTPVKRKIHLKKELATNTATLTANITNTSTTSTITQQKNSLKSVDTGKKIPLNNEEKRDSDERTEDFLDISINEKINL